MRTVIITRTPLRISFGGGGTDLPSYYREFGGFVISAAINKYVYITINKSFLPGYLLKYSEKEHAEKYEDILHPLLRETLILHDAPRPSRLSALPMFRQAPGWALPGHF